MHDALLHVFGPGNDDALLGQRGEVSSEAT
jgi:hypothetical protein